MSELPLSEPRMVLLVEILVISRLIIPDMALEGCDMQMRGIVRVMILEQSSVESLEILSLMKREKLTV